MNKIYLSIILSIFLLLSSGCKDNTKNTEQKAIILKQDNKISSKESFTIIDQANNKIEFTKYPNRIVNLWPANNQVILMLGGIDKIVGTSDFIKKNPWFIKVFPKILDIPAPLGNFQIEELIKLNPDLVIVPSNNRLQEIKNANIKVVVLIFSDFNELIQTIKLTAKILGPEAEKKSEKYITYLNKNINFVLNRLKNQKNLKEPRVLHVTQIDENTVTVNGKKTIIDEWINSAGGENVIKEKGNSIKVSLEEILALNPEIIIVGNIGYNDETFKKIISNSNWSNIDAVKNKRVYKNPTGTFPWDRYSSEEALQILWAAKIFHPNLFKDIDMKKEAYFYYKTFLNMDFNDDDINRILDSKPPK